MNKAKLLKVCVCGLTPIHELVVSYHFAVGMCRNNIAQSDVLQFTKTLMDALDKYQGSVVAVIDGEDSHENISAETITAFSESAKEMVRAAQAMKDALSSLPEAVQVKITDQAVGV